MASGDIDLPQVLADELRRLFQADVEAPLPPLILQLLRQLHEKTKTPEDDDDPEPPRRRRADLFLPGARSQWWSEREE